MVAPAQESTRGDNAAGQQGIDRENSQTCSPNTDAIAQAIKRSGINEKLSSREPGQPLPITKDGNIGTHTYRGYTTPEIMGEKESSSQLARTLEQNLRPGQSVTVEIDDQMYHVERLPEHKPSVPGLIRANEYSIQLADKKKEVAAERTELPELEISPKGKPLELFKKEFQAAFVASLSEEERPDLKAPKGTPAFDRMLAKYQAMKKEAYTSWMEANQLEQKGWQSEILDDTNKLVKDRMDSHGLANRELKTYLIPAELMDDRATAWSYDNYGFIAVACKQDTSSQDISSILSKTLSHQAALHEAYHLNAEGFSQHRLEEGAADWMMREDVTELLNQGKAINFFVTYRTDVEAVGMIVDKMAENMQNELKVDARTAQARAKETFEKAYLRGDTSPLKQALGAEKWGKIESIAKKYDDPFLDQGELRGTYLSEIKKVLQEVPQLNDFPIENIRLRGRW